MPLVYWTESEDKIVLQGPASKVAPLLQHRTIHAISIRRRFLRGKTKPTFELWTKVEDRRIRKYQHETLAVLAKRFPIRSTQAVRCRRNKICDVPRNPAWTGAEHQTLSRMWKKTTKAEIMKALARHSWSGIQNRASTFGFTKQAMPVATGSHYLDELRKRAREDRIPIAEVGIQSGVGSGFLLGRKTAASQIDYNKIAKCVEFFGGKLVIDWQDE